MAKETGKAQERNVNPKPCVCGGRLLECAARDSRSEAARFRGRPRRTLRPDLAAARVLHQGSPRAQPQPRARARRGRLRPRLRAGVHKDGGKREMGFGWLMIYTIGGQVLSINDTNRRVCF